MRAWARVYVYTRTYGDMNVRGRVGGEILSLSRTWPPCARARVTLHLASLLAGILSERPALISIIIISSDIAETESSIIVPGMPKIDERIVKGGGVFR